MPNYYVEGVKGVVIMHPDVALELGNRRTLTLTTEPADKVYCDKHDTFHHWWSELCPKCISSDITTKE